MTPPEALRARAADLRAIAVDLEQQAAAIDVAARSPADEPLFLDQLSAEFGFSRESLASAARDGLKVNKGARGRLVAFRGDVEAWIRSRAWSPACRRKDEAPDDALARAERELLADDGGATRLAKGKTAA